MPPHRILLFATRECPHCQLARRALAEWGEPFEERDPSSDPLALRDLLTWSPRAAVPTIVVGGRVMIGFDADRLAVMLSSEAEEEIEPEPSPDDDDDEVTEVEG